jgi:heme-degrading monooxygenase HmoA
MIVELAILRARPGTADQMRAGLQAARAVISRAEGYRGSTFHQGIEDPQRFVLRIEWDSVEAHTEGFRGGPLFPEWRSHWGEFLDGAPDVQHYQVVAGP